MVQGVKNKNILKLEIKIVEFTFKFIQDLNLEKLHSFKYRLNIYQNIKKKHINCEFLRSKKISGSKSKIEDAIFEFL